MKPKFLIAAACMIALFSVNLAYGYYPVSPYAYCMGNPIKFVDPNGEEVWIHYNNNNGTEEKLLYTGGMSYKGSNSFVSHMVDNLNAVYSNGGDKLLDVLIASNNAYAMVDQPPTIEGAGATIRSHENGGKEISAQMLGATHDALTVEGTAHELMHCVQYEYGQGGQTIFNEVEAYVFGYGVSQNYISNGAKDRGSMTSLGIDDSAAAAAWETSFTDLVENGYSKTAMVDAVCNFKAGAQVNQSGKYSTYPLIKISPTHSILFDFWAGIKNK